MLKLVRDSQRWIVGSVILIVGVGFVFFMAQGRPAQTRNPNEIAVVGDIRIDQRSFQRVRARQEDYFRQTLGEQFDQSTTRETIDQLAISALVRNALYELEAHRLGFYVSDDEIRALVSSFPALRDRSGKFSQEIYKDYAERYFGSELKLVEALRSELLANKLQYFLTQSVNASDEEVREAVRFEREKVALDVVTIDATPATNPDVSDEELGSFKTKEDEALRSIYQERIDEFETPGKVHIRQILLQLPADASDEKVAEVRKRADALRQRLVEGADFAKMAEEESDDLASKQKGGDLGELTREQLLPALSKFAFESEIGTISEPIQTQSGLHILKTEARTPSKLLSFEEVGDSLARELFAKQEAESKAQEKAAKFVEEMGNGATFEATTAKLGLRHQVTGLFGRSADSIVPGLGKSADLVNAAFDAAAEGSLAQRIFIVAGKPVIAKVAERKELTEEELEAMIPAARKQLLDAKRNEFLGKWLEARQTELQTAGQLVINRDSLR